MAKKHFSPSSLNMLFRCGEQYRRSYMEGEKIPPGVAAVKGRAVHGAAEVNFEQKVESHRDISKSQAQEAAAAAYESALNDGVTFSTSDRATGESKVLAEAKDRAIVMTDAHMDVQAPEYQPVLVEQRVRLELPQLEHDLVGIVDMVDSKNRVVDLKTSKRKKNQHEADHSIQLTAYAAMTRQLTGKSPEELRLDVLVDKKSGVERQVVRTYRGDPAYDALAARIQVAEKMVQAGLFAPVDPGHWCCHPSWCGYWDSCPYVDSERKGKAGL